MQTYPPGTRIGQYEIASRPMMGGMGVVYFALDHGNDGRPVALKTFRPELLPDRAARDRFLREGTAWIELGNHPHIVRCYKVEYIDPTAFLVLELIAKEQNMPDASLRSWLIPGRPMPLEQALLFALQIARGMQYATEKIPGFVHRDLKPENILVGADRLLGTNINRLRVTDFGLVKTIADSGVSTVISNTVDLKPTQVQFTRGAGTPLYMAPEQWKGEPVGVFTDVYAFGCILFEMVTGQPAAEGKTISQLREAHSNGQLSPLRKSLPEAVARILQCSLMSKPIGRYQCWGDMTQALEQAYVQYSGGPVPAESLGTQTSERERTQSGHSHNAMGTAYLDMGMPDIAKGYFEEVIAISREIGDRHLEGRALGSLAISTKDLGEVRKATKFYEQTLVIVREIGDRRGEAVTLGNLGLAHARLGETHKAIEFHQQALEIDLEIGDRRGEVAELSNLGIAQIDLGDPRKAIEFHQQSLALARKIGDRRGESGNVGNLGIAYANLGNTRKAIEFHEQHLIMAREIGDRRGESNAFGNLGIAHADLGDTPKAIEFHKKHLILAREIGDRDGEANALGNLGLAYETVGDTNQAIALHGQCLIIKREIGDRRGEANALSNIGIHQLTLGDIQRAVEFQEQALTIRQELNDINGIAIDSYNLALIHTQQGETARALRLAQDAAHYFVQIGNPRAKEARQLVSELQSREHDSNPQTNHALAALEAVLRVTSSQEMQVVLAKYPFIASKEFIQAVEKLIIEEVPSERGPAFQQRLNWLRQIAAQK